ncbi:unnamed protein product [Ceutorhynchus assimilis]|uniref:Uncharacterized protein n=1 Tax=Ceutorhynchus assimilis TaxID=467358 RepID=A0A9N9MX07_9CUCU|nr:unnamed protein product [Ceutorhynchus assimilis]
MKFALVFLGLFVAVICAPPGDQVPIVSQESDIQPDGSFRWSFQTGDGTRQEQQGQPKQIGQETAIVLQGAASWKDNEGKDHQLTYIADENGYQPQGSDIPQIPPAIARALEYNAAHPEQDRQ